MSRFGNLRNGVYDIKTHSWYREISWNAIYERKVHAPYKPTCKSPADASNFDVYDEESLKVASVDKFDKEFADF